MSLVPPKKTYLATVYVDEEMRDDLEAIRIALGPDLNMSDVRRMAYREFIARHKESPGAEQPGDSESK